MKTLNRSYEIDYSNLSIDRKINSRTFIKSNYEIGFMSRYKLSTKMNYCETSINLFDQPMYLQDCYVNEKESIREDKWKY